MTSQETFGRNLRRARQHRGVSLTDIASQTNVKVDLWEDMERNDFTRWPAGIYARTWIRSYAELIGVDPDETVNDFCRWFPQGDRRAETVLRKTAELVGHQLTLQDDLLPVAADRRAPATSSSSDTPTPVQALYIRLLAATCDLCAVMLLAIVATLFLPIGPWAALGIAALPYHALSVALAGCSPAVWAMHAYTGRRPGVQGRGGASALRRLERPAKRRNDSVPLGRGAAS